MTTFEKEPSSIYVIRFQDCDPFGHLNNSKYIDYMLNAREDHLEKYYNMRLRDFLQKGMGWVVGGHDIYYMKPGMYNEKIKIHTSLVGYGEDYVITEGLMSDEADTHYKALLWTRYFFVDARTGKKGKHTEELMDFFSKVKNEKILEAEGSKSRFHELLSRIKAKAA